MFNTNSPKEAIILEQRILQKMTGKIEENQMEPIDSLTYTTFVNKFNEQYGTSLLSEQKELLNHYITSFSHNDLETKIFLNREIGRLKESLDSAREVKEIKEDPEMLRKTQLVRERLEALSSVTELNKETLTLILKTQELIKEVHSDDS
jgi:hypothetical protein